MDATKKYITQLTANDLKEIAATVNAAQGVGINLTRNGDNVTISIDQQALASMIYSFCQQQGIPGAYGVDPRQMSLDQV